jgi:hypothetical protein
LFKYAALAPIRGEFLESYYVLMRYLDDVVDGDAPLPSGYGSAADFILDKLSFVNRPGSPSDEVDCLILYCYDLGRRFNQDFSLETEDIMLSLLFDARRKGKSIVFPEEELEAHFHQMDIRGTIRATLKVFGEDPGKYTILEPLGVACRYQYDIEDIFTDLSAGYVNITREECDQLNISLDDLHNPSSDGIKRWLKKHAMEGLELLSKHKKYIRQCQFSWVARTTFPLVYERPARAVFEKTIEDLSHVDL